MSNEVLPIDIKSEKPKDSVSHPPHYNAGKIEVIEFIEDQRLGYHLSSVIKYVCRAGRKDKSKRIEDLRKALWYLMRKIELLECKERDLTPLRPNQMATPSDIKLTICVTIFLEAWRL